MIKNKYAWFDQERVGQGSMSPLRDARSLLKECNTTLLSVSDVVFSSFNPKSLTGDKSRGEMPGIAGMKRAVREPGSGDDQPAGSWWSWTGSCIRARRPWPSGCPPWPSACPWTPARRGCRSCEGTAGCLQHAASRGWPCSRMGRHCTSCKVTLGLVWRREAWLVLTRNCWQLGGRWVPGRKGKNISNRVRHSGPAVKEAALRCCPQRLCTRTRASDARGTPITTPLDFRGTVTPLCFAFKTSYPASALHTSPSSLSQSVTSHRCLGNTHREQGRNCQAPPYARPPSHKLLFRDSLSSWLHLIITFESYCWSYLWRVCPISLTEHLHLLVNESHGLEQVGCNIDPPSPNFAWGVGHRGEALAGSAVTV